LARAWGHRATLLSAIAGLPGEDRRPRLLAALAASDEALQHYRPDTAPLAYAATQNNRATLLSEIAGLPGEDRRARLLAALAAYDEALQHYRPDTAPLAYAMTQNNRATLLSAIAGLPGEDRRPRLLAALRCAWEAHGIFVALEHAPYQEVAERVLRDLRTECGDAFGEMWGAAGLPALPDWLAQEDDTSQLQALFDAFVAVQSDEQMVEFWRGVPAELEEPLMQAVEGVIAQAKEAGETDTVEVLQPRLDVFRQIRAAVRRQNSPIARIVSLLRGRQRKEPRA